MKLYNNGALNERHVELMTGVVVADTLKASEIARIKSIERFDDKSPAIRLQHMIQSHCEFHKVLTGVLHHKTSSKDMWKTHGKDILPIITAVCEETAAILSKDTRVLYVNSPCYVIGGIHGHFKDLMILDRQLWVKGKKSCVLYQN